MLAETAYEKFGLVSVMFIWNFRALPAALHLQISANISTFSLENF